MRTTIRLLLISALPVAAVVLLLAVWTRTPVSLPADTSRAPVAQEPSTQTQMVERAYPKRPCPQCLLSHKLGDCQVKGSNE